VRIKDGCCLPRSSSPSDPVLSGTASPRPDVLLGKRCMDEDSNCDDAMLRVGSRVVSGIGGTMLSVPVDCAETEIGIRQRARNHSLAFTGNLPTGQSLITCRGTIVIL